METQQLAEKLYCTSKLSQDEISTLVGINRKTLYKWAKEKNWVRQPQAEEAVPLRLLSKCYNQIEYLLSESEFVDPEYCQHHFKGISVMIRAVNSLKPKKKDNPYATVMTEFMKQVHKSHPGLAITLTELVCQFIQSHSPDMPSTPSAAPQPPIPEPIQNKPGIANSGNQTPTPLSVSPISCAAPRRRLIKPKTCKPKASPQKQEKTAKSENPTTPVQNNLINQNNNISERAPHPNSALTFGVHGVSHSNNKLLQNNHYEHIISNLRKENPNANATPHTPFYNFSLGNKLPPNAAHRTVFAP